jgi:hypothetical protein
VHQSFLDHAGRMDDLARDWPGAIALAAARLAQPRHAGMPPALLASLDDHWAALARALADPAPQRQARQDFLRALVVNGLSRDGPGWAMLPFLSRAMRHAAPPGAPENG